MILCVFLNILFGIKLDRLEQNISLESSDQHKIKNDGCVTIICMRHSWKLPPSRFFEVFALLPEVK